jgi:putative ubiquitin-RnfH superfamily antitoxin RatB of RatAB toxin-antitoxin module
MWSILEQVGGHYTSEVKKSKMNNQIQDIKKDMNRLGVPVRTMHLSEDGEMSYTMDTEDKC